MSKKEDKLVSSLLNLKENYKSKEKIEGSRLMLELLYEDKVISKDIKIKYLEILNKLFEDLAKKYENNLHLYNKFAKNLGDKNEK